MIYYDIHIHSCLSPCADDDMTPNNIVNMAKIKGLDLISVTDHNSTLNQRVIAKLAKKANIKYLYGVEIETKEEIHTLAYFTDDKRLDELEEYLNLHLIKIKNDPKYFGNQIIMDENDEIVAYKEDLLISAIDVSVDDLSKYIKSIGGYFGLAHVNKDKNSIFKQLAFIDDDLVFDILELYKDDDILKEKYKNKIITKNSDAHSLIDINERINYMVDDICKI